MLEKQIDGQRQARHREGARHTAGTHLVATKAAASLLGSCSGAGWEGGREEEDFWFCSPARAAARVGAQALHWGRCQYNQFAQDQQRACDGRHHDGQGRARATTNMTRLCVIPTPFSRPTYCKGTLPQYFAHFTIRYRHHVRSSLLNVVYGSYRGKCKRISMYKQMYNLDNVCEVHFWNQNLFVK